MQPRAIILEGPDGTGKTTLAKVLARQYGYHYHHEGPPPSGKDLLVYYLERLWEGLQHEKVVFDRLFVGQDVYGPILRNERRYTGYELTLFTRVLRGAGIKLVFCLPSYETAYKNWKHRKGELFQDNGMFQDVYESFSDLANAKCFSSISSIYSIDRTPVEDAAAILDRIQVNHLPLGVIGNPTANFLFVGDVANHDKLDLPFISNSGCSPFLYEAIKDAGFSEDEIAFANAFHIGGKPHTAFEGNLGWLAGFKKIIALGGKAASYLNKRKIDRVIMTHPQFWKRFHSARRDEYVNDLKNIRKETYAVSAS